MEGDSSLVNDSTKPLCQQPIKECRCDPEKDTVYEEYQKQKVLQLKDAESQELAIQTANLWETESNDSLNQPVFYFMPHGSEQQQMAPETKNSQWKILLQIKDGNSFFRCLSQYFTGSAKYHRQFRVLVANYLYCLYIDEHPAPRPKVSVLEHVKSMLETNTCATECEIYAAAHLFHRRIDILTGGNETPYFWSSTIPHGVGPNVSICSIQLFNEARHHFDLILKN